MTEPRVYPSDLLTIRQMADLLQVNHQTVRRWIKQSKIKVVRLSSRTIRIPASELDKIKDYVTTGDLDYQNSQSANPQEAGNDI